MRSEAEAALDVLDWVAVLTGTAGLRKADEDPLTDEGLDAYVDEVVRQMSRASAGAVASLKEVVAAALAADWVALTTAQREAVLERARARIEPTLRPVATAVARSMVADLRDVVERTTVSTKQRHSLTLPKDMFEARDDRAIAYLQRTAQIYMRDRFGAFVGRSVIAKARAALVETMQQGLSSREASRTIARAAGLATDTASERYFELVADAALMRARTWSQLRAFEAAGIRRYEFVAVMDDRTSNICRAMDGQTFDVRAAIDRFERGELANDLGELRRGAPFGHERRNENGGLTIYAHRGFDRVAIAHVHRSGVGHHGDHGDIEMLLDEAALLELGFCTPPLHPRCRSALVPAKTEFEDAVTG